MLLTRLAALGLCLGIEKVAQLLDIFRQHFVKSNAITEIGIARNYRRRCQQCPVNLQRQFQLSTACKRKPHLDIAAAFAQVRCLCSHGHITAFGLQLDPGRELSSEDGVAALAACSCSVRSP
jgi:hypothetical protein